MLLPGGQTMIKKSLLLAGPLAYALAVSLVAAAQGVVSTAPIGPVWEMHQSRLPLYAGEGGALSADGKFVAYMGIAGTGEFDNTLFLLDLETATPSVLLAPDRTHSVAPMFADQAAFSPDGGRIVFARRGQNSHYPSDICTIGTDGQGFTKLTKSALYSDKPAYPPAPGRYYTGASYQRYYYSPRYSPDGSRILILC